MVSSTQVTIVGSLNSTANSQFRIEFFSNTAQDGTGHGEGQTYLGFVNVTTNGSGNANFNTTLTATVSAGSFSAPPPPRVTPRLRPSLTHLSSPKMLWQRTPHQFLMPAKSPALTAINEDAGAPVRGGGHAGLELVDFAVPAGQVDNVTDADTGALLGIADHRSEYDQRHMVLLDQ